jgi:hypothetical protein
MERNMTRTANQASAYSERLQLVAGLSLGVGIVHLMLSPEQLGAWWGYGFFFMFAGLAQITYGLLLFLLPWLHEDTSKFLRSDSEGARLLYIWGAWTYLGVAGLFLLTHTIGVPAGPHAGMVEPISALGLITTVVELVLAGLLLALARQSQKIKMEDSHVQ